MTDFGGCMCMQYAPHELLALWQKRAMPVLARLLKNGHDVDLARFAETAFLVASLDKGAPECFSEENRRHSHHLPGCAWRARRGQPVHAAPAAGTSASGS